MKRRPHDLAARASRAARPGKPDPEQGAALLLALGFVVMVGAICGGLLALVTSSVGDRAPLDALRARQYAADGAVEDAITQVRVRADAGTNGCAPTGGHYGRTLNGVVVRVDCDDTLALLARDGVILQQHDVIFTACEDRGAPCTDETAIVRAQVNFERGATGPVIATWVQSWSVNG